MISGIVDKEEIMIRQQKDLYSIVQVFFCCM